MPPRNLTIIFATAVLSIVCYLKAERNRYAGAIADAMETVSQFYVEEVDKRTLFENAMQGMAAGFMSGQGKSFFIHDLLKKVIFAEQDWVSHDARAVRRTAMLRTVGFSAITLATLGLLERDRWERPSPSEP